MTEWINAEPRRLADFKGKVVLVRWFTGTICPDCTATAPALKEFEKRYRDFGLTVVGMFHQMDGAPLDEIMKEVAGHGFEFPVAIDRKTATRKSWCRGNDDFATSVTFLLDRDGVIRHVHPGGRYVRGDQDYRSLDDCIRRHLFGDDYAMRGVPEFLKLLDSEDRETRVAVAEALKDLAKAPSR